MKLTEHPSSNKGLLEQIEDDDLLTLGHAGEEAWIEVIRKMDSVYADLVRYQVELEEKNAALEEAQNFIRSVLAAMTDVLIVCDAGGRIQRVNRALEMLTGRSEAELKGTSLAALADEASLAVIEAFPEKIRSGGVCDCEVSLKGAGGKAAPLSVNCSPRYDRKGRLSGMVLIGRPLGELRRAYKALHVAHGELKQAQRQLVQSEKMASLGRLVAGVAHELNNPISFVFGNTHALKRYGERITAYLDAVHEGAAPRRLEMLRRELKIDRILQDMDSLIEGTLEGAERVSEIVQDLRRFSAGQREHKSRFDLSTVVRTATHWVAKASREKPQLALDLPKKSMVTACRGHLHQIIVNLVQNALDAMERQPVAKLEVSCGSDGEQAWVRVRDYGPGIAEKDLLRVFDPFFTTKEVGKGTGLGLYISYGLATEQVGGQLVAENHPEGGAVFTLKFPRDGGEGRA